MRWRMVVELMKGYHQEPPETRQRLLADAWVRLAMSAGTCRSRNCRASCHATSLECTPVFGNSRTTASGDRRYRAPRPVGIIFADQEGDGSMLAAVIDQPDADFGNLLSKK
jgi:hypothetical protein